MLHRPVWEAETFLGEVHTAYGEPRGLHAFRSQGEEGYWVVRHEQNVLILCGTRTAHVSRQGVRLIREILYRCAGGSRSTIAACSRRRVAR